MGTLDLVIDPLAVGTRVGDYVLEDELSGREGDRVFHSKHILLPRRARIVVPTDADRALEAACVLEALRHPAVPRVYECGVLPDLRPYLVLALVDGTTLAEAIAERTLAVRDAVALIADVAAVLAHAHAHGIVHGELAVDRIAKTKSGWRISDWSDAGAAHDTSTDVHALGVIAYGALARSLPTLPLLRRSPGVPVELARLIDRMIADPPAASDVLAHATQIAELLAVPAIDDDLEPIAVEDIILVELAAEPIIPPPTPGKLRWTPAGGLRPLTLGGRKKADS